MDTKVIAAVQKAGFQVYMTKTTATWLYFTDGTRIGYLQDGWRGLALSTVHLPNSTTGTGYALTEFMQVSELTRENLERAFITAPGWSGGREVASVTKWKDMAAFIAANKNYGLVPATEPKKESK